MTTDPLKTRAIELLTRGHGLYGGEPQDGGVGQAPRTVAQHLDRLTAAHARAGMRRTGPAGRHAIAALRRAAGADAELAAILAEARADHAAARGASANVLADAHGDPMPAADTPVGRREALRRMAARIQHQRRTLHSSRQHSRQLAHRTGRLAYPHRRHARPIPLDGVHYAGLFAPGGVRKRIAAALDHLGITDPAARRNWLHGYQTLIARESGGRPSAVASEPATTPGPVQADGHLLGYARGITQTLPETFARYHQPGTSRNIFDPVANICASMNYVMHRYGVSADGANLVALVQQADARRPPKGY